MIKKAFYAWKLRQNVVVHFIHETIPVVVETEASDHTIAISLNETSKPVAFFSNILNTCEQKHSTTKKAYVIVDAPCK